MILDLQEKDVLKPKKKGGYDHMKKKPAEDSSSSDSTFEVKSKVS